MEGIMENEELFDGLTRQAWFDELETTRLDNRRHLYALWSLWGTPSSMLDVGCGNGDLVLRSRQLGIEAYGIDQLVNEDYYDHGWFVKHDLRQVFSLASSGKPSTVDLVLCWEVAEHLSQEYHEMLCNTCAMHLHRGNKAYLVFTAAHPGQGGMGHIGEHPATYWRDMFHDRGLNYMSDISRNVALLWSNLGTSLWWLAANVQVFERG